MNPQEVVDEYLAQFPAARATEELPIVRASPIESPPNGGRLLSAVAAIALVLVIYGSYQNSGESPAPSSRDVAQASAPIESLMTGSVASGASPATTDRSGAFAWKSSRRVTVGFQQRPMADLSSTGCSNAANA